MADKLKLILGALDEFQKKIDTNEVRSLDASLPSINIWCFCNEYFDQMVQIYSLKEEQERFLELFDTLELDWFSIDAHDPYEISKGKAIDYIKRVKKKLVPKRQTVDGAKVAVLFRVACAYQSNQLLLVKYPNLFGSDALAYSNLVVSGLLAMELFLKFLKAYELYDAGDKPSFIKDHDLSALYSDLSEERQKAIKDKLEDKYRCANGLEGFLEKHRRDFVEYRYLLKEESYESDVSFIAKINDVLYDASKHIIDKGDLPFDPSTYSATYDGGLQELAESCEFMARDKLI